MEQRIKSPYPVLLPKEPETEWIQAQMPAGTIFYHNSYTDELVWERPQDLHTLTVGQKLSLFQESGRALFHILYSSN